ncbi:motility associated factor glycosyltransferase family protein [Clostridium lundense]|uniref:motility associated factor glycosyltransferase family protein n=1 Tax=Clostridium lundense TaxID=319475 RepID=UPI0004849B5E|nr:6-hydroxymethylpterin diphosphokinase MptE-like protein [Clostridium lundense]
MNAITKITLDKVDKVKESFVESKEDISIGNVDEKKTLNSIKNINSETSIILIGLINGKYILEILKKTSIFNKILIVEPNITKIMSFLKSEESSQILEDDRVNLYYLDNLEESKSIIGAFLIRTDYDNFILINNFNYDKVYDEVVKGFLSNLREYTLNCLCNVKTMDTIGKDIFSSYLNNIPIIINSTFINTIKGIFSNKPAVIVSAGPSLEKNINKLKDVQNNVIIIAGNRTLKPLLERGIMPDFMCAVDPCDEIYHMVEEELECKIPLVFHEGTNSKLVNSYNGQKIFFRAGVNTYIEDILGKNIEVLFQQGSVAHACTSLAKYLGCNPISFIGQDLAYTNNQSYANCTELGLAEDVTNHGKIFVKSIQGEKILTSYTLDLFRSGFENFIKSNEDTIFINSTEGGAHIQGTLIMDLDENLNIFGQEKINKNISQYLIEENIDKGKVIGQFNKILSQIIDINKKCKEGKYITGKILKTNNKSEILKLMKKIYRINNIIDNFRELDFISVMIEDVFNKNAKNFRYKEDEKEDEITKSKKLILGFNKLYTDLNYVFEENIPLIKRVVEI